MKTLLRYFGLGILLVSPLVGASHLLGSKSIRCEGSFGSGVLLQLEVGDGAGNGYDRTRSYLFCTNTTNQEIQSAYRAGSEVLGFDLSADIAVDYEDDSIPATAVKALLEHGVIERSSELLKTCRDEDNTCFANSKAFVTLWTRIARLGNPALKFESIQPEGLDIGGYGLIY